MVGSLLSVYQLRPTFDRFKPIFETACENDGESELPGNITGDISIQHVSFAYGDNQKPVLRDICLDILPGEYIGIVGASGCGKSTLLKLLLGFEVPDSGQIFYGGQDLRTLDKQALRKNLGVVLQNGKLIAGSIYENITVTAPEATMTDVQSVLEAVGLKDDVAQMPMGVQTVLSESSGTISGGQQQRIMIARAIIGKPAVLIFDEATSALDNLTQAAVCASLDKMNVTRIVVAHRLSTIRTCDRIVVLQDGSVAEEGNYETLMKSKGLFYQLASRQIAE
jgi:ATP-binding cassette subfamily C protein